jgi:hypothetical protein
MELLEGPRCTRDGSRLLKNTHYVFLRLLLYYTIRLAVECIGR